MMFRNEYNYLSNMYLTDIKVGNIIYFNNNKKKKSPQRTWTFFRVKTKSQKNLIGENSLNDKFPKKHIRSILKNKKQEINTLKFMY